MTEMRSAERIVLGGFRLRISRYTEGELPQEEDAMPTARDIALIFLSLEALVMALLPLVIISALAYGVYRLHRLARVYLRKAQLGMQRVNDVAERVSQRVTRPLISGQAAASRVMATVKKLRR